MKTIKGTFDVSLSPQDDGSHAVGRFLIDKTYQGEMKGRGIGQMLSHRVEGGISLYYAIERFTGTINNKKGTFIFCHEGLMDAKSQSLKITTMAGSGTDDFATINGTMKIIQNESVHTYEFEYTL